MPRYEITFTETDSRGNKTRGSTTGRADNEWKMRARFTRKFPNATITQVTKIAD